MYMFQQLFLALAWIIDSRKFHVNTSISLLLKLAKMMNYLTTLKVTEKYLKTLIKF